TRAPGRRPTSRQAKLSPAPPAARWWSRTRARSSSRFDGARSPGREADELDAALDAVHDHADRAVRLARHEQREAVEVKRVDAASVEPRATEANVRVELGERREPPAEHVGAACELEGVQRRARERVLHLEPVGRDVSDEAAVGEQKQRAAVEAAVQSLVPAVVAAA